MKMYFQLQFGIESRFLKKRLLCCVYLLIKMIAESWISHASLNKELSKCRLYTLVTGRAYFNYAHPQK